MRILVPVRYPLNPNNRSTIRRALEMSDEHDDAELVFLHIDLFQDMRDVSRNDLRREIEGEFEGLEAATYVVRKGFIVEESILEESANQEADVIVIGRNQSGRLRRTMRRLIGNDADVEDFLRKRLDARIEVVG